ncbi:DUF488 domain-containing protein [Acrocarpospora catenulata]|uniref:DUF488 domain-containing protein n=1 Tax=Acrocarpospora catenulata TaxID=2836182 RepID=UPI001BDB08EA|nr:DUF488 family protein [Acrocarpospora catenulata]
MQVERVYDESRDATAHILVDRLWPRGVRKDDPRVDEWVPEVAPSTELRRWYGHQPERFEEFTRRYERELDTAEGAAALARLTELAGERPTTLVTATRDLDHSHAKVLAHLLEENA